jgi:hypothetical protein
VPRLAIVIASPGGASLFEDTLVSVLQHRPAACEVFVVHTEAYSDPYQLAGEVTFLHVPGETNPSVLLNRASQASDADVLHVIGCGVSATDGWTASALRHFQDDDVGSVVPLVVSGKEPSRLIAAGMHWSWGGAGGVLGSGVERAFAARLAPRVLGPHLQAAFYRRDVVVALGGWDEQLPPDAAALDLAISLCELEFSVELETECTLLGSAATIEPISGKTLEQLYWRHRSGAWSDLIVGHPWQWLSHAATHGAGELADRVRGLVHASGRGKQLARLAAAREQLADSDRHLLPFPGREKAPAAVPAYQRKAA